MEHNAYRTRLEEMLRLITEELKTVGIHNPENPSDWVAKTEPNDTDDADENLTADHIEDWNERVALVAELEARYNNIVAALERTKNGSFGTCEICGETIESERLDVNPAARTCIAHREGIA